MFNFFQDRPKAFMQFTFNSQKNINITIDVEKKHCITAKKCDGKSVSTAKIGVDISPTELRELLNIVPGLCKGVTIQLNGGRSTGNSDTAQNISDSKGFYFHVKANLVTQLTKFISLMCENNSDIRAAFTPRFIKKISALENVNHCQNDSESHITAASCSL